MSNKNNKKNKKLKKGFYLQNTFVMIILGLIIVITLVIAMISIKNKQSEASRIAKCKTSLRLVSTTNRFNMITEGTNSLLECPTKVIKMRGSDEKVLKTMAKEYITAIDVFNNGKLDLFQEDGIYCHIYDIFDFSNIHASVL